MRVRVLEELLQTSSHTSETNFLHLHPYFTPIEAAALKANIVRRDLIVGDCFRCMTTCL